MLKARILGVVSLAAFLLMFPSMAKGDICEEINTLSNGWNDVANALDRSDGDEIADLDVDLLARDVEALLGPTERLGNALVEEGNDEETAMGDDLLDLVEELREVEVDDLADYLVEVLDDVVDSLDDIVDFCDEQ